MMKMGWRKRGVKLAQGQGKCEVKPSTIAPICGLPPTRQVRKFAANGQCDGDL